MEFFASLDRRRVITAVVVLLIALGSGHLMQTVLSEETPVATRGENPDAAPTLKSSDAPKALPLPPAATLMPILERPPVLPDRVHPDQLEQHTQVAPAGSGDPCASRLSLQARPAALVEVVASYPCSADTVARVAHGGLVFQSRIGPDGVLRTTLPAMAAEAVVTVVADNHAVSASVEVPDAGDFDRVALVWSGARIFSMHAFEFGADRSQFGHVWAGAPKRPDRAARGSGGFLMTLGDGSDATAEVYTFPVGLSPMRGVVRLLVEADVTEKNCGRLATAKTLQTGALGVTSTDVELSLPDCSAVGETVRLQNLLQDMRLAGR